MEHHAPNRLAPEATLMFTGEILALAWVEAFFPFFGSPQILSVHWEPGALPIYAHLHVPFDQRRAEVAEHEVRRRTARLFWQETIALVLSRTGIPYTRRQIVLTTVMMARINRDTSWLPEGLVMRVRPIMPWSLQSHGWGGARAKIMAR